jgi:ComF family protein
LPRTEPGFCRDCSGRDLSIDGIRSPLLFQKLTREIIHQFKYKNIRTLAPPLAILLNAYIVKFGMTADVLVPVPIHPARLRERGYNQALLLANELERLSRIPVCPDVLKRLINTPPQARTSSSLERHRNMQGVFTSEYGKLKHKKVLLIDDVSTSGATLDACAMSLKKAGAASVWGLTVAREV